MRMYTVVVNKDATGDIEAVERELRPLEYGEALVEVEYCGVCHTDSHAATGDYDGKPGYVLGHEDIGLIKRVARGMKNLKAGDHVNIAWLFRNCGSCEYCSTGRETLYHSVLNVGYTADGGMVTHCIVSTGYAVRVPEGLGPTQASSITCAGATAYKAIKVSGVRPGQQIAIYGTGGLGNLAVQYAKKVFGVYVVAVNVSNEKLTSIKEADADLVINAAKEDAAQVIQEKAGGAHTAVMTAVSAAAFNSNINYVRAGGRVVAVGLPPKSMDLSIPRLILDGTEMVSSPVGIRKDLEKAFQFGTEGLVVPEVELRALDEVPAIFQEMHEGKIAGRMMIDMDEEYSCIRH